MRVAKYTVLAVTVLATLDACCDRSTPRVPKHWLHVLDKTQLRPTTLERVRGMESESLAITEGTTTRGEPFFGGGIEGFVFAQPYGFWLEIANTSAKPIRILWPNARYVDERGRPHAVFRQPMNPLPPPEDMQPSSSIVVAPGSRIKDVIAPIYKSYIVAFGCAERTAYREPLVPTVLKGKTEPEVTTYIGEMLAKQTPVKLVIPTEVDGQRSDYVFTFVLRPKAAELGNNDPG
jgi:hypothetical protein